MPPKKLTKKQLAGLNTASPNFIPAPTDKEEVKADLAAITGDALTHATEEQLLQAKRAIASTRRLVSGMSGLARALTHRPDMKVVVRTDVPSSCTDGLSIIIKPNYALGAEVDHDRRVCGHFDPVTELPLCPACKRLEYIIGSFYHEVAHNACGTFDPVPDAEKAEIVKRSIAERGAHVGSRAQKLLDLFEREFGATQSMVACKIISPYLGTLLNCLEDARVNAAISRANSGMTRVFRSRTRSTFVDGIPCQDGSVQHWNTRHHDEQVMIGCYLVASGYTELLEYLSPEVAIALNNWDLRVELNKIANAPTVHAVYAATFPILEHLRGLGFLVRKDDPEDDPAEEMQVLAVGMAGQPEDGGKASGDAGDLETLPDVVEAGEPTAEGGDGSGPTGDDPSEDDSHGAGSADETSEDTDTDDETDGTGEDNGEATQDDETDDATGGDEQDDGTGEDDGEDDGAGSETDDDGPGETDDPDVDDIDESMRQLLGHEEDGSVWHEGADNQQDLMRAVDAQFDQFDSPSRHVLRFVEHEWNPKKLTAIAWGHAPYNHLPVEVQASDFNKALAYARIVFANNAAVKRDPMQRSGQINQAHLCHVPTGMKRPFKRTRFPNGRDYKVGITLDCSGSTDGPRNAMIRQIGLGMATMLDRLPGVDFEMWGHTATFVDNTSWSYASMVFQGDMHKIKGWGQTWGTQQLAALQALHGAENNLDGHTLEFMRKRVEATAGTDRIIFYLTDGEMPAANRVEETEVLVRELKHCERTGIKVIGIGVNTSSPTQYGLDTIRMDDPSDLRHLIREVGKRLA